MDFPKNVEQLEMLVAAANEDGLDITVICNASNLLISDKVIGGVVIILTDMYEIKLDGDTVAPQAGATIVKT
ncbi:FAD-binding protein, partial [Lactobacillus jensenii]|uniref:FAD-binding protein n=1 Tax=Lactobacillus jensenii TaxID=109790 RepID=UPI002870AFC6